jgi:hypothetical protein
MEKELPRAGEGRMDKKVWKTRKSAFLGWEWGFGGVGIGKNTDQKRAQTNYK